MAATVVTGSGEQAEIAVKSVPTVVANKPVRAHDRFRGLHRRTLGYRAACGYNANAGQAICPAFDFWHRFREAVMKQAVSASTVYSAAPFVVCASVGFSAGR